MNRTVRLSMAAFLLACVIWSWRGGGGILTLLITVLLGALIGVLIAPDIGALGAKLFVGTIMADEVKYDRPPPVYGPARTLAAQERWYEAIEAYRQILRQFPGDVTAQRAIAEITLEKLGDLEGGVAEYNRLLGLELEDAARATILMRLAELYEQRFNQRESAVACLTDVIRRFPGTKFADSAQERLARLGS
jgi:tetratricopeptide (TPR) repeat protein